MKIIFLDVDGVLNHIGDFGKIIDPLNKQMLARLEKIVSETGAQIVLSSTWRKHPDAVAKLKSKNVLKHAHEDWRTKDLMVRRGWEIQEWLDRHPDTDAYVIIDDDNDMLGWQQKHFVQTHFKEGLLDDHVEQVIDIFKKQEAGTLYEI